MLKTRVCLITLFMRYFLYFGLLVCNWPHSVRQNHLFVKMLFNKDSAIQKCFQKTLHSLQVRKFNSLPAVRWRVIPSGRPSVQSIIRPDDVDSRPNLPLCREASNCSSLHPFRRFSSSSGRLSVFNQALGFLSKTQIWEDCCNHLNDVDSRPNALIHKASIVIQIQMFERQSSWSGRASIRYGNCMHQISRPDDHPPGPNARSLYMKITCSGRATVRTTGHHHPDAAHFRKEFQRTPRRIDRTIVRPDGPWLPSGLCPVFIKPDAHLNR
jgi:hypothetical protein